MDKATQLKLTVMDKERIVYDGLISSLTSVNDKGTFDILPAHTNFISIVKDKIVIRTNQGQEQELKVGPEAVLRVLDGEIKVFVGFRE